MARYAPKGNEDGMEIVGRAPELAGLLCEAFICEGFAHNGKLVANANVVHVCFAGVWHNLVIDCGVIIWRPSEGQPNPWRDASEGWEYPHVDVGTIAGVVGHRLEDYKDGDHRHRKPSAFPVR